MAFSIALGSDHFDPASGNRGFEGEIRLGTHSESFIALGTFWGRADYEAHWRQALLRVSERGLDSCLITSIHDPRTSHLLFWWLLYPEGERVNVQNGILFFEQLERPFTGEDPFASIPARRTRSDDGNPISEWQVNLSTLTEFLKSQVGRRSLK